MPLDQVQELLVPSACYSPQAIRAFLRYSRQRSDDNLHNALPRTGSCSEYLSTVLFPEWLSRDTLLTYCSDVAAMKKTPRTSPSSPDEDNEKRPDPRFDPYGARDYGKQPADAEESIKSWVATEKGIESIIRQTSADHLARKCGTISTSPQSYIDAYEQSFKPEH